MDDTTKLSPKLLQTLLSLLKIQKPDADLQPQQLFDALTPDQQQTAKQLLSDPQKLQAFLKHPQVQSLLRTLQQNGDDHGGAKL